MIRPRAYGPRSVIFTTTDLLFAWFVTRTHEAKGKVRCAAVSAFMLKRSPLAVLRPWNARPYHEARPCCSKSAMFGPPVIGSALASDDDADAFWAPAGSEFSCES